MKIRSATIKDTDAIYDGECAVASKLGLLNAAPGEIPRSAFFEKIQTLAENPRGIYVVAELEEQIVGHLHLTPMPLAANSHICTLNIVVHNNWQERGVGRALLEHAILWAKGAAGVEKIELMVRSTNARAISLYRSVGFKEEGQIQNRVKLDERYIDDIAMCLFT